MKKCLLLHCLLIASASAATIDYQKQIEPILIDFCFDCHGDGSSKGDFSMDDYTSLAEHVDDIDHWMAIWENVRAHIMPPAQKKQLPAEQRALLNRWITETVFKLNPDHPDPGRVTVRRLNREEYEHTIYDVLGFRFDADDAFPPDDTGYGFDNVGDALNISTLLMEKYFMAASHITREVVPTEGRITPTITRNGYDFRDKEDRKANNIPFDQPGTYSKSFKVDHPGEYRVTVEYCIIGADKETDNTAKMLIRVNDHHVKNEFLAWGDTQTVSIEGTAPFGKGWIPIHLELQQGNPAQDRQKNLMLEVQRIHAYGPLDRSHTIFPAGYERIFIDGAPPKEHRAAYLRKLTQHWGTRLWRRPLASKDLDRLLVLAGDIDGNNQAFEKGFATVLTALLTSPRFIFRAEIQPDPNSPGSVVPLDEFALASRLSYFFWRSAPDAELLYQAAKGTLRTNLRQQVDRLIAHQNSERFVKSFTRQWLQTGNLELIDIDPRRILKMKDSKKAESYYNYRTRAAMREESEMLFTHILTENRPILDFLIPDYTFVNEYLALNYGIKGIKGREMRKITLPAESPRGGILGQGAFLVITSNPTRTSPVKRGLFVLENLLGSPAPPPPEEVPTLEEQKRQTGNKELSIRELMAVHREDSACAGCHARFDPIGLALENFNAIGMWRTEEEGKPIQTDGHLITGESFANTKELSHIIATNRKQDFYRCLTEKLLTYALGRGIEYYDAPTVTKIIDSLEADDGKMMELIYGIVESTPFQMRRGDG